MLSPALAGCLGGTSVDWGTGDGEYHVSVDEAKNKATIDAKLALTITGAPNTDAWLDGEEVDLTGCDNGTLTIEGWLSRTQVFDEGGALETARDVASIASFIIQESTFENAQDVQPNDARVAVKEWTAPTVAKALPPGEIKDRDFPHAGYLLIGIIPANENIMDAALTIDWHQPVKLTGYIPAGDGWYGTDPQTNDCRIRGGVGTGWAGAFVVTELVHGEDASLVDTDESYVQGDVPIFGRAPYTLILLFSIGGAVGLFVFSRGAMLAKANGIAQAMMSDAAVRSAKGAEAEVKRHERKMKAQEIAAQRESKEGGGFDVTAALETEKSENENFATSGGVVQTQAAFDMDAVLAEAAADREAEMEAPKRRGGGARSGGVSSGGVSSGGVSGGGVSSARVSKVSSNVTAPEPAPEPEAAAPAPARRKRATRRTRKVAPAPEAEPEPEPEPVRRQVNERSGPDLTDDEEFSDFSF